MIRNQGEQCQVQGGLLRKRLWVRHRKILGLHLAEYESLNLHHRDRMKASHLAEPNLSA